MPARYSGKIVQKGTVPNCTIFENDTIGDCPLLYYFAIVRTRYSERVPMRMRAPQIPMPEVM